MESLSTSFLDITSSIPGYGIISQILLQKFGIDTGDLVSTYLIVFALYQVGQCAYNWLSNFLSSHFTSYVEIDDWDLLYNHLTDWASAHPMIKLSRKLKAVTFDSSSTLRSGTLHDNEDSLSHIDEDDVSNTTGLFNFHKWNSKSPLIYKPNFTSRYFSHNGHLFHWTSDRRASLCNQQSYDQFIVLRCFGRSAKPIKDLLHEIKGFTLTKEFKTTEVYRSSVKAEVGQWLRQSVRPSRPVRTVSLDEQQKERIISDINEYLQPNIARWYAMRGIPHRRGYLFHGPPGTGKTSLSFALAGVFGLSIYCVSLSETGLTESHLAALFRNLPDRCIVLLEDIDAAGLRREGDLLDPSFTAIETGLSHRKSRSRSLISLAGLLNIIDGAASQEGRVLIMTTNHPKSLDPALIRPGGRIDLQIKFTLATREQIRDMYKRMYIDESSKKTSIIKPLKSTELFTSKSTAGRDSSCFNLHPYIADSRQIEPEALSKMAEIFADKLPEKMFSPAEIQGFLLERKTDPQGALVEVEKWRDEQIQSRGANDEERAADSQSKVILVR